MRPRDSRRPLARMIDLCQVLAGQALTWFEPPDSGRFEDLFTVIASPMVEVERLAMETTLERFTTRLGSLIHANFHSRFPESTACAFAAQALRVRRQDNSQLLLQESLSAWAEQLRWDFWAAHSSAAEHARRLLNLSAARISIDELASAVAVGKRTLERHFRAQIGMSIAEYRTRLRVALVVRQIHERTGCVESAALIAGWASKKALYERLYERTGLRPTDIRDLPLGEVEDLIATLMICGRGAQRCAQCISDARRACLRHHTIGKYAAHFQHELGNNNADFSDRPLTQ